jgi:hypothetical protein
MYYVMHARLLVAIVKSQISSFDTIPKGTLIACLLEALKLVVRCLLKKIFGLLACIFIVYCSLSFMYFICIVAVSYVGGGNRRKLATCCKSMTNVIT